jgi:hypothetical protein
MVYDGKRRESTAHSAALAAQAALIYEAPATGRAFERQPTMNVKEMSRGARPAVQALLEKMDEDGSGEIEQDEMLNFFADHIHASHEHSKTKKYLFGVVMLLVISVVANAVAMMSVGEALKENHTRSDGAMTDLDGRAVSVAVVSAYTTLFDLPLQSVDFMKNMKDIVVVLSDNNGGGITTKYTINGWQHYSSSYMTLDVGNSDTIVLKDGSGYLKNGDVNTPILTQAAEGVDRRKLTTHLRRLGKHAHHGAVHTFSWEDLKELHKSVRGDDEFRRLSEAGDALSDLYMFFGGVLESNVLPETGNLLVECDVTGTCGETVEEAPRPEIPGLSKWQTFDTISSTTMTWYMDLADVNDARVHIVTPAGDGTVVHEIFKDQIHYRYFSVTSDVIAEGEAVEGEAIARALEKVKNQCTAEFSDNSAAAMSNAEGAFVTATHEDGSATWQVGPWEVVVAADGDVTSISQMNVQSIVEYVDDGSELAGGVFDLYEECDPDYSYDDDFAVAMDEESRRRLESGDDRELQSCNWWSAARAFFVSGAKYGNFCGKGAPGQCTANGKPTVTIGNDNPAAGMSACADCGFDASCAKHDSGSEYQDIWGFATLSLCEVDRVFKQERTAPGAICGFNDGVDADSGAVAGANCLFDVIPCLRYEWYSEWYWVSRWWGGYPARRRVYGKQTKWVWGNYPAGGCRTGTWGPAGRVCWNAGGPGGH